MAREYLGVNTEDIEISHCTLRTLYGYRGTASFGELVWALSASSDPGTSPPWGSEHGHLPVRLTIPLLGHWRSTAF
jgi:hypothetical protein